MNENPVLYIREGEMAGTSIPVESAEFVIGRGSECDLTLPERQVSRNHAIVEKAEEGGGYIIRDLGSRNGTHVNGEQVSGTAPLRDGDELAIALAVKMVFIGTDATVPLSFEPPVVTGKLLLEESKRTAIIAGKELSPPLSLAQFRLLKTLVDADGGVCDRDSIVDAVWPGTEGFGVSEQAIDALVRRLRDRLTEMDEHQYVVTVRGHGFRLDNPTEQ